jgi:hypothetical protein
MKLLVALLALSIAWADSPSRERIFRMKDGSSIRGEIVNAAGPTLRIRSRSLGELSIARDEVETIDGREDFALRFARKEDRDEIRPDGTIDSRLTWIDRNTGDRPLKSYRLLAEGALQRVTDPLGLPLPVTKEDLHGISRCTISLGTPVPAGETFMLLLETIRPNAVEEHEGKFTWQATVVADQPVSFERVVVLPEGASVEDAQPAPDESSGGKLVWRGNLSAGESFKPRVTYRLS